MGAEMQELLLSIKTSRGCLESLLLVFLVEGEVLTRATTSTSFGYCDGGVGSRSMWYNGSW